MKAVGYCIGAVLFTIAFLLVVGWIPAGFVAIVWGGALAKWITCAGFFYTAGGMMGHWLARTAMKKRAERWPDRDPRTGEKIGRG